MKHARLVVLAVSAVLLLGACADPRPPSAVWTPSPYAVLTPVPTTPSRPAGPTSTPSSSSNTVAFRGTQIFDAQSGVLVRTIALVNGSRISVAGGGRGFWSATTEAIELRAFTGEILDRLEGDWTLETEDRTSDVRVVASTSGDKWLWLKGEAVRRLPAAHYGGVSSDGNHIAYSTDDYHTPDGAPSSGPYSGKPFTVPLWILNTRTLETQHIADVGPCQCDARSIAGWSPSGRYFASADFDYSRSPKEIDFLFDTSSGTTFRLPATTVVWEAGADTLLLLRNNIFTRYDPATRIEQFTTTPRDSDIALAVSPDGNSVARVTGARCQQAPIGRLTVEIASLATNVDRLLVTLDAWDLDLRWSLDSKYLIVRGRGCGQ